MTAHDTYLQLAAVAIDFPLAPADRGRLEQHLAGCPACVRGASALRGDALAVAGLPAVTLPERRGAEILAEVLHPGAVSHPLRLLVLAALLGLMLLGSLAVGAQLIRHPEEDISVVVPPVATQTAPPGQTPGPDTSAGPVPMVGWQPVPDQETVRGMQFLDVTWTGSRFVAAGGGLDGNDAVVDSRDGLAWHRQPAIPGEQHGDVAAGSTGVVMIGTIDGRPSSWYSPDGLTWTASPNAFKATAQGTDTILVTDVVATPSGWLAVGREDPACNVNCGLEPVRSIVWTSPDGLSWQVVPDQEALLGGGMNAVSAYDGGYVAAGVSSRHAALWTSTDGRAWSRVPDAPAFHPRPGAGAMTDTAANGVASNDGVVVVAGADTNDGYGVRAWWSTDGVTWTSVTGGAFEDGWGTSIAAVSTGFLITGGVDASTCHAGMWESADGRTWRCAATDAVLDGFGPYVAASSATIDLVVGLTTVGYDENSGIGNPGAAWWRAAAAPAPAASASPPPAPAPSSVPTAAPTAGASGELVAVLDVRCGPGAPDLGSDRVRASRDGVRIRVTGEPGWYLGIEHESGRESVPLDAANPEIVLRLAPGDVRIDCGDPTLPDLPPASALRIEDPDGWYHPSAISDGVGSCVSGSASYGPDARGKTTDPVGQARALLRGLKAGDVVERAGYATDKGRVRVVRADKVIGSLEFEADGHGGWLLMGSSLCGNLSTG